MNLYDVIPAYKHILPRNIKGSHEYENAIRSSKQLETLWGIWQNACRDWRARDACDAIIKDVQSNKKNDFDALFARFGGVPTSLYEASNIHALLSQSFRVKVKDIKQLADSLSFIIIPFPYLKRECWRRDNQCTNIELFTENLPFPYTAYVLCPVSLYDITAHIAHAEDMQIYAGKENQQAFVAIQMMVPMFRTVIQDIAQLNNRVIKVESEVQNLNRRISQLSRDVENQKREQLMMAAENAALRKRVEKLEIICALDPLLLAIPKGDISNANTECLIGPCWGPDFNNIIFELLKIKTQPGQRNKLEKAWSPG